MEHGNGSEAGATASKSQSCALTLQALGLPLQMSGLTTASAVASDQMKELRKWKSKELVHNRPAKDRPSISPAQFALTRCSTPLNRRVLTRDRPITRRFPSGFTVYPSAFPTRRIRGATTPVVSPVKSNLWREPVPRRTVHQSEERNHNGNQKKWITAFEQGAS